MPKVAVYTTHYMKPEFIALQKKQFEKYCRDDYELVILNNGKDPEMSRIISDTSRQLDLRCIEFNRPSDIPSFCSHSHIVCLDNLLANHLKKEHNDNLTVIMDNDVFPFKDFSFFDILNGKKVGGMYQQRNYNGVEHEYLAAILTMFYNNIDMTDFVFHAGVGDTGAGTRVLLKRYETEFVKHTAAVDIEKDCIFTRNKDPHPYESRYRSQFLHDCFIHYYRGSNWSESCEKYHADKMKFLLSFLDDDDRYGLNLDEKVCYEFAHSNKGYNGVDHAYRNYRFVQK
jgi:hypothetical protein